MAVSNNRTEVRKIGLSMTNHCTLLINWSSEVERDRNEKTQEKEQMQRILYKKLEISLHKVCCSATHSRLHFYDDILYCTPLFITHMFNHPNTNEISSPQTRTKKKTGINTSTLSRSDLFQKSLANSIPIGSQLLSQNTHQQSRSLNIGDKINNQVTSFRLNSPSLGNDNTHGSLDGKLKIKLV